MPGWMQPLEIARGRTGEAHEMALERRFNVPPPKNAQSGLIQEIEPRHGGEADSQGVTSSSVKRHLAGMSFRRKFPAERDHLHDVM